MSDDRPCYLYTTYVHSMLIILVASLSVFITMLSYIHRATVGHKKGSAATKFRCGERFYFTVFRSLSTTPKVKELLKSVHICQSYRKNKSGTFFSGPRCTGFLPRDAHRASDATVSRLSVCSPPPKKKSLVPQCAWIGGLRSMPVCLYLCNSKTSDCAESTVGQLQHIDSQDDNKQYQLEPHHSAFYPCR